MPLLSLAEDFSPTEIAAALPSFDRQLLHTLGLDEPIIVEVLAHSGLEADPAQSERLRLNAAARRSVLDALRQADPLREIALHTALFERLLVVLPDDNKDSEADCLAQLDRLFFLLGPREGWHALDQHVHAFAAVRPLLPRTRRWLSFYTSAVALNAQRYDEAQETLVDILAHDGHDPALQMRAGNAMALTHFYQGQFEPALALYDQLGTLARSQGSAYYQGIALLNAAMIYHDLEQWERALSMFVHSLSYFQTIGDGERSVIALFEIGNTALHLGRWVMAERYLNEAIVLAEQRKLPARLTNLYWGRGLLAHLLGREAASEADYLRAIALAASPEHPEPRVLVDSYWYLAFLYITQGRFGEALATSDRALQIAEQGRRHHTLSLIYYQRGNLFARMGDLEGAYESYAAGVALVDALRANATDDEVKVSLLGSTQQLFAAMILCCLERGQPEEAFAYMERARSRALLDALAQPSAALTTTQLSTVVTLDELQAVLPPDAILLAYFTTGLVPQDHHLLAHLPPEQARLRSYFAPPPQIIIYAIQRHSLHVHGAALDPNLLQPDPNDPAIGQHLLQPWLLPELHKELIAPVAASISGKQRIFIVPHGPLHYVPFPALHDAEGGYLLREDGPVLAFAPSATILLRQGLMPSPTTQSLGVAIGANGSTEPLLTYAESEASTIAQQMGGQAWIDSAPKAERLFALAARLHWLHIACHAVYQPARPLHSYLRIGPNERLDAQTIATHLRLSSTIVSLSSCLSGVSRILPGDELLGLPRAFFLAGASTIICTRWETDDLAALLVMNGYYRLLGGGADPALALHQAVLALRSATGRTISEQLARLQSPDVAPDLAELLQASLDERVFSDPWYWASFMCLGGFMLPPVE